MKFLYCFFTALLLFSAPYNVSAQSPSNGKWLMKLQLNEAKVLPFQMELERHNKITIYNDTEKIELKKINKIKDTFVYEFPDFNSHLYLVWNSKNTVTGYWLNKNKTSRSTIPLFGKKTDESLFNHYKTDEVTMHVAPKQKVIFSVDSDDAFPAVGLFKQSQHNLCGTFLTETGDFRFLSGNVYGNSLYLSCFDGSHAFLFEATLENGEFIGTFYSGKSYQTNWIGEANNAYQLTDPYKLTYIVNKDPFTFDFNDINGQAFSYPSNDYKGKVIIVQIMGTWCPNCMDETRYYLDLYNKYNKKGLEIILVGFEIGNSTAEYTKRLQRLKERYNIPFKMLVGGAANKQISSEIFPMLNAITSYPTSIIIDREGKIVKIHTGFYGPGTGEYYTQYVKETEQFLLNLLKK